MINETITLTGQDAAVTVLNLNPPWLRKTFSPTITWTTPTQPASKLQTQRIIGLNINSPGGNIAIAANGVVFAGNLLSIGIVASGDATQIRYSYILGRIYSTGSNSQLTNNSISDGIQSRGQHNNSSYNYVSGTTNLYTIDLYENSSCIATNTVIGQDGWPAMQLNYAANNTVAENYILSGRVQLVTRLTAY